MKSDSIWKTYCALHNMLLDVNGLANGWENGVRLEWDTEEDCTQDLSFALRRLIKPGSSRNLDILGIGYGNNALTSTESVSASINNNEEDELNVVDSMGQNRFVACTINKMSLQQFRSKLIRHFNIAFHQKKLSGPVETKIMKLKKR